jgi:hypothetical protein
MPRLPSLLTLSAMLTSLTQVALASPDPGTPLFAEEKGGGANDADLEARPAAPAQVKTLAILILSGEEAGLPLSEVYLEARKVIENHTAINVLSLDTIGVSEREGFIRDCAGKAACFASKVRDSNVSLLLTVSVDRLEDGLLLGLRLIDVATQQEVGASGDEVPSGMSVGGAMEQQLSTVFPGTTWDQIADVTVTTEPANAEVAVGGRTCASPCTLTRLVPGSYEVSVKKEGYLPWKGNVTLVARQNQGVSAVLQEPPAGLVSSPLFWGLVGLAAVGTGVAIFLLARPTDRVVRICIADDPGLCE